MHAARVDACHFLRAPTRVWALHDYKGHTLVGVRALHNLVPLVPFLSFRSQYTSATVPPVLCLVSLRRHTRLKFELVSERRPVAPNCRRKIARRCERLQSKCVPIELFRPCEVRRVHFVSRRRCGEVASKGSASCCTRRVHNWWRSRRLRLNGF